MFIQKSPKRYQKPDDIQFELLVSLNLMNMQQFQIERSLSHNRTPVLKLNKISRYNPKDEDEEDIQPNKKLRPLSQTKHPSYRIKIPKFVSSTDSEEIKNARISLRISQMKVETEEKMLNDCLRCFHEAVTQNEKEMYERLINGVMLSKSVLQNIVWSKQQQLNQLLAQRKI